MREALPTIGTFQGPGHVGTGARRVGLIERYADHMPLEPGDPVVSLNEGSTPLIHLPELSERLECELHVKFEGLNPTGSFKDRGMTVAVSGAVRDGAEAVICASTGNTAASLAAYAARAGIRGIVLVPDGKIAMGKLAQALMHGAQVLALRGNFDEALRLVRELTRKHPIALVNSVSPYRIEGQKTAAFEIVEDLGGVPDALAIPVGNAGNITAYWKGFREAVEGWIPATADPREHGMPVREFVHPDPDAPGGGVRMFGFQAAGANPLVTGVPVPEPETIATAIRIGNPARWEEAMDAVTTSRGRILDVTDAEILDAYRLLAREGVFCEPASATSVAGLLKHGADGAERVVAVLTGHGLKDPQTALEQSPPVVPCEPTLDALERRILD